SGPLPASAPADECPPGPFRVSEALIYLSGKDAHDATFPTFPRTRIPQGKNGPAARAGGRAVRRRLEVWDRFRHPNRYDGEQRSVSVSLPEPAPSRGTTTDSRLPFSLRGEREWRPVTPGST